MGNKDTSGSSPSYRGGSACSTRRESHEDRDLLPRFPTEGQRKSPTRLREEEDAADSGARPSATQKRERESAAAVLGRPTRAREKRLGPVDPAAKTESRPARVGFHAAGYTGKFFSFVFFFFSNFPNTFSNQIFLNQIK
jgi:hypothetical protein